MNPAHLLLGVALDRADGEPITCERKPSAVLAELLRSQGEDRPDAWAILGQCRENRRGRDRWERASGVVLDFDYEDPSIPREEGAHQALPVAERDRILDALEGYTVPGYAYATPRGVRVGHVLDEDVTDAELYAELVGDAAERLHAHLEDRGVPVWRRGVTGLRFDACSAHPWHPMRVPRVGQPAVTLAADRAVHLSELRGDVPRLDLDRALPADLAEGCRRIADWIQVPVEVVVTGLLALSSAAIGNTRWVVVRGLAVPLSLHYLTVLRAGNGKSSVRSFLRKAVDQIEREVIARRQEAQREREQHEERLAQWRNDGRSRKARGERGERPAPPSLSARGGERVSFIVSEATFEGIIATQEDTPRGFLWASDEAHEVLGLVGRYGSGDAARALDAARLRRIMDSQPVEAHRARSNSSPVRRLPRPWLAIDADVQPAVFANLFAAEDRLSGLTARFLVHSPPSMEGKRRYVTPPPEPGPEVLQLLQERLVALSRIELELQDGAARYAPISLEPEAERLWAEELELLERRYPGASDEEAGALGHARGRVLRLAGVLTLLRDPEAVHVTASDMLRGIEHMRYHLAHHRQLLGGVAERDDDRRLERLREQAERLLERQPEVGVRPSDLAKRVSKERYGGELGRRRALADLHGIGWVLRRPTRDAGPGRPPVPAFFSPGARRPSPKPPKPTEPPVAGDLGGSGDARRWRRVHSTDAAELLDRASQRLLARGAVGLPRAGRRAPCLVCGSSSGLGVFQETPWRWYCHSVRHRGGGCAVDLYDPPPEEWTPGEGAGMLPGWKCPCLRPDGSTVRSSSVRRSG